VVGERVSSRVRPFRLPSVQVAESRLQELRQRNVGQHGGCLIFLASVIGALFAALVDWPTPRVSVLGGTGFMIGAILHNLGTSRALAAGWLRVDHLPAAGCFTAFVGTLVAAHA
jgi:hypothetical protein